MKADIYTWLIAIFGLLTFLPLMAAQMMMIVNPNGRKTKDLIIGKGEDWRDDTHLRSALAFAWADWLVIFPLLILGHTGVFLGVTWGFALWLALGVLSVYFSVVFWVLEKKYTYPSVGPLVYFTYIWGFFLYWGVAAIVFSLIRIIS
jgi:hypothetical protein